jgi:transposase
MSQQGRKQYSREFRIEAVRQSCESGKGVSEVARELGIPSTYLYRWRDVLKEQKNGETSSNKTELDRLRRENARLREERDILKKAAMYFADESLKGIGSSKGTDSSSE